MEPEEELHGREFLEGRDTTRFQLAKPLLVFSRKACKGQFVLKERKCGGINHIFFEHGFFVVPQKVSSSEGHQTRLFGRVARNLAEGK